MPRNTDPPPKHVAKVVSKLRGLLDAQLPRREVDRNLLVATWNIRHFGDLTSKWTAGDDDSPKRDLSSLLYIAEILARFDVIAVQEVTDNIKALRHAFKALGPEWGFIMTDVALGSAGNNERMAYIYDTRRVKPSGLAGELVVPPEWLDSVGADALTRQFARTPYAVSFQAGHDTFILVTLHVLFGAGPADRIPELNGIARWMADWARREKSWGHNFIALGDFNVDRKGDEAWEAFTSTGLRAPDELNDAPRTIFASGQGKFYDQIAWFTGEQNVPELALNYTGRAGFFDFVEAFPDEDLVALSWRLSDHYPLWTEFEPSRR